MMIRPPICTDSQLINANPFIFLHSTRQMRSIFSSLLLIAAIFILETTAANQGSIRVCNRGAYVARCYLESRTADGRTRVYETGKFPVGQCPTLELPFEAVSGRVWCDNYVFISTTKRVFEESFNAPSTRCYEMSGTTLHPSWGGSGC